MSVGVVHHRRNAKQVAAQASRWGRMNQVRQSLNGLYNRSFSYAFGISLTNCSIFVLIK